MKSKNGNDPTIGNITEEKESELEEFIDFAKIIMGTMGHKVFESLNKVTPKPEDYNTLPEDDVLFYLKRNIKNIGIVEATGKQTPEGFVVLQGSHISSADDDTIPIILKSQRKKAVLNSEHVLPENMLFSSPSYATMFVIGKSSNGLTSWKTAEGITLKALEQISK